MIRNRLFTLLLFLLYVNFLFSQQIVTDNTLTPQQLIQNLVGENCASVNNISSPQNGNVNNITSFGSFDRGSSNFPLESGIILSTGNVTNAGNSIFSDNLSDGDLNWQTDPDVLNVLGIDQTLNATSIQFNFTTANNFVAFKYLFASDEYQQDYPCTFKDVFAILIRPAGSSDPYVNIALVPETATEISTNTIHPNINGFCDAMNEDYFQGYNLPSTNFNGQSTVLIANTAVIPNEEYEIKFVIADHIDERFDSAVFIEAEGFGGAIDLGPDQSVCGSNLTLNADINNPSAIYTWFLNGNPIAGENNPTLLAEQSGSYNVEITIPSADNNCMLEDSIEIEIIPYQEAAYIEDLSVCDPAPSDGVYDFDLELLKNDEILAELPASNYIISYHTSQEDAQNNINPILGIYQNTQQEETIYVKIESLSGDCLQIGNFQIIVNDAPNTLDYTIDVCNSEIDDVSVTNLSSLDFRVSNFEFNTSVTYYLNESDAINQINEIEDIPSIENEIPFFIARVESLFNDCYALATIYFDYQYPLEGMPDKFVFDMCLPLDFEFIDYDEGVAYDFDSMVYTYDLLEYHQLLEEQYPGFTFRTLLFPLLPPEEITTSSTEVIVPLAVSSGDFCEITITMEIHKNLLYSIFGQETNIERCDDSSNDGIVDFDLLDVSEEIKRGYDIEVVFYQTEEDAISQVNPIDQSLPYSATNAHELFIGSSYEDCSYISKLRLNILESTSLSPQVATTCGIYNADDDTTTIFLQQFNNLMAQDVLTNNVDYYLTEEDAINEENVLGNTYDVTGNTQRFYVKINDLFLQCADITTLDITIPQQIEINPLQPLIACDDNLDGFEIVDLANHFESVFDNSSDYNISYYSSSEDAFEGINPIDNPSEYNTASDEIFIRIQVPEVDCFAINNFEIQIYDVPQIENTFNYVNCEVDSNMSSNFIFEDKDSEIIGNQQGMQVLYFETENDAINRENEIDKTVPYQNTSNPQTIYARLENESGNACYNIAPIQIEVRQAPDYNAPSDVFECDISNTGFATTDLNSTVEEIALGSSTELNISFHATPLNAELGTNAIPLNYTATTNPQIIYTRIENANSGCYNIESFNLNTLSLPEVTYGQSLVACGNNYDTSVEWNLTEIELNILDGRQYNIDFTYFNSEVDAQNNVNAIGNPTTYTNSNSPETVYARVRNATTDCFSVVPFELIINSPPAINQFGIYDICDNNTNTLDLHDIDLLLVNNTFNVLISYYQTTDDAENDNNALSSDYIYTNTIENLVARVEYTTTGCYAIYPFELHVNPLPLANQPDDIIACDDDFDGQLTVNLSQQDISILNGQNPDEFSVSYYNTEVNAIENNNILTNEYVASNNEVIFARVENNITGCFNITQFSVIVNNKPFVAIDDQVLCLNDLPLVVSAETNNPTHSYEWSTNETSSSIEITTIGSYSVTVTNEFGCQTTSTFSVTESNSAEIDVVETINFADPNNIIVTVTGIGNYLYQLNDEPFQTSGTFYNVPIGHNTITIIDQNGCAQITKEVLVIDTPKHMTPNGDGQYDTWHITGVETLPGTVIYIFDRYGKLIKTLLHTSPGWDGSYNGNPVPAGDYWFIAKVIQNNTSFEVKGHFALRR